MIHNIRITTLVENTASGAGLSAEHGLSFWIEYGDKKILFDTGQSDLILHNAQTLGIDLTKTDMIILSHGHYDHTGGLKEVLSLAENASVYFHPAALEPKYNFKKGNRREIGIAPDTRVILQEYIENNKAFYTKGERELLPGFSITGQIPRNNDFEDTGGNFFLDRNCNKPDTMLDDQAIFFDSPKGLVILLGCAHAGVVNTLHYAAKLSGETQIYAVMGGMHLLKASAERIEYTIDAMRRNDVRKIGLAHCTGSKAIEKFKSTFPNQCFSCSVGKRIEL
jgi:7,8-dihydropterin-6-yl-methyl-4-(beta-D-ribofuranosyl)aminobenzene 5'-phosphate synthase